MKTTSHSFHRVRLIALASLIAFTFAPAWLRAQIASPAVAPDKKPTEDEAVRLSPFEVSTDSDTSYGALNSNSITSFNTELSKLPVSADIFTESFMKDVGATSIESVIQLYSPGAGFSTSDPGGAAATTQDGDRNGNAYIQLRGLSTPTMQRDGFMPVGGFGNPGSTGVGLTSNFDIERAEVVRGPQALLYGGGGAGGIINAVSKQARFNSAKGSFSYQVNQYGGKLAQFDYDVGTEKFAVRTAFLNQNLEGRRLWIGGDISGQYLQFAYRPFANTTIRLTGEQSKFYRINNSNSSVTMPSGDTRANFNLHYLLATGQTGAFNPLTSAAYKAGAIDNGHLDWDNADSFAGWQVSELVVNDFVTMLADTRWTNWLTTRVSVGYDDYTDDRYTGTTSILAPGASGNTLSGWSASATPGGSWQPARSKAGRVSALITRDLFHNFAHTQTIFGADYLRTKLTQDAYRWYQDGVGSGATRVANPVVIWSIDNGPIQYPGFYPGAKTFTLNGTKYVRAFTNPPDQSLVSASDPLGVVLGGGNYIKTKVINSGYFGMNSTTWGDGRLNTLVGFRLAHSDETRLDQGAAAPAPPGAIKGAVANTANFNAGVNYALTSWLRPYIAVSDSYDPPAVQQVDPLGNLVKTGKGLGGEVGLKFNTANNFLSGSLAAYKVKSKNEEQLVSATLLNDINPSGLNGRYNGGNQWVNVDRTSQGAEFELTASPGKNWRLRLGAAYVDGTIGSTVVLGQVYNDQFYANPAGQVTYRDRTVVFVSDATKGIVASTAAGAVPLTITKMSTSGDVFYANPAVVSGAISGSSSVGTVLKTVDATHGPILTGITGLPISKMQINPGFTPPGAIPVALTGEKTVGYAPYSLTFTGLYNASEGPLKNFSLGGSARLGWQYRNFYYYPAGIVPGTPRSLYSRPTQAYFDVIAGYEHRFPRVTFVSRLNINNVLDTRHLLILPNSNTGYVTASALGATYDQEPRAYVWTNEIRF